MKLFPLPYTELTKTPFQVKYSTSNKQVTNKIKGHTATAGALPSPAVQ